MNDDLNKGITGKYTLFIKLMYEGLRLKVLESPIKKVLYRGAHMTKKEIKDIKECLNKKRTNSSKGILFCRAFLSFSCKQLNLLFMINFLILIQWKGFYSY